MAVYLITFSISYLLCYLAERLIKKSSYVRYTKLLLFMSVLVVATMAGLRDNSVGIDTKAYTTYLIEYGSRFHTLKDFFRFYSVYEPGFKLFAYIIGVVFNHSSHWFLFWCAMLIYGFTMKAFYFYRNNCSISLAWVFFLLLNCSEALNITRNYIALAITAYAFTFAFKKDIKRFIIWTIVGMTFHVSAAVVFLFYYAYKGLHRFNNWWYKTLVVIGTVLGELLYEYIFRFLSAFTFIGAKTGQFLGAGGFSIQLNPLLIRLPFILIAILHKRSFCQIHLIDDRGECNKHDVFGEFCYLLLFVELILSQLRGINETLYRLVTYVAVLKYVSYSIGVDLSKFRVNRYIKRAFAYVYVVIVFCYWVVKLNSGLILPYTSNILGITG